MTGETKETEEEPCEYYRVRADIDLNAIRDNILNVRDKLGDDTKIMAVIKADGYGHGAVQTAKALHEIADAFGVAIACEGCELRRAGIFEPILILGYTEPERIDDVINYDLIQTVFDINSAEYISERAVKLGKTAKVHVKLDTGMGRIGFRDNPEDIADIGKLIRLPGIRAEGVFTHFAKADETDKTAVRYQYNIFLEFLEKLRLKGIVFNTVHASNSAAIIDLPEMKLDMVRCGIATYGLYPSDEVDKIRIVLKPAMSITGHISFVKKVGKGQGISYNGTYITTQDTIVATVPVGYADGYPRALSSKGRVLIRGKSAPVIGRICMDQFMIDVTEIPDVKQGDRVTLVGTDGNEHISVEELADLAGSFNYEFVCGISKRVPRRYI